MNIYESIQNAIEICASQFPVELVSVVQQNPIQIPVGLLGVALGCFLLIPSVSDKDWYENRIAETVGSMEEIEMKESPTVSDIYVYKELGNKLERLTKGVENSVKLLNLVGKLK